MSNVQARARNIEGYKALQINQDAKITRYINQNIEVLI